MHTSVVGGGNETERRSGCADLAASPLPGLVEDRQPVEDEPSTLRDLPPLQPLAGQQPLPLSVGRRHQQPRIKAGRGRLVTPQPQPRTAVDSIAGCIAGPPDAIHPPGETVT